MHYNEKDINTHDCFASSNLILVKSAFLDLFNDNFIYGSKEMTNLECLITDLSV